MLRVKRIWVLCPLCGAHRLIESIMNGPYPISFYVNRGLGRGRGFAYEGIKASPSIMQAVKEKVKALYFILFGEPVEVEMLELVELEKEFEPVCFDWFEFASDVEGWDIVGEA